ncbi:MAG: preprotein translocase subunit SecY [bacterium ADurb.Bin400]|nr:MAG: preprotein translocase subunit SecY [bacterium ADurb.Bin400]
MEKLAKIWEYKDLRKKVLVVIGLLLVTRILAHIPLPGVDLPRLQTFFQQNQAFGLLNMFSGGTISNFSIVLMGVGPYITSSIIFQLLAMIFPKLEELQKEGESGRQKINQYTRITTVPLAFIQAYSMLVLLKSQGIVPAWTPFDLAVMLISVCAGTVLMMWIGEIITEKGIGNGVSLIIMLGILSDFPTQIRNTVALVQSGDTSKLFGVIAFVAVFILVVAAVVFVQEGQRNIPISYAKKLKNSGYGTASSFLPIRVNIAGVIPIIFALSLLVLPTVAARFLEGAYTPWIANAAKTVTELFNNQAFYGALYFLLVFAFTYFYTGIVFKPEQIAENLQKQGGYIPGIRPGTETREYLSRIIVRITLFGAVFLGLIAVLPFIVQTITNIDTLVLGGTGVLIIVSVIIETIRQINSQIVMHTYDIY